MTTPKLQMPELSAGQSGKEITHNQALARLDQAVNSTVLDKDLSAPPGSPSDGAGYIVAASPTGAWAGKANNIAFWRDSSAAWDFIAPFNGLSTWVEDESKRYEYKSGAWAEFAAGGTGPAVVSFTADRTLGLTDVNTHLRGNLGTQLTATIAPQASVAWAANSELRIEQAGVGSVVIAPGAGVTINKPPVTYAKTKFQFGVITLKRVAADVWTMFGDIAQIVTSCAIRSTSKALSGSTASLSVTKPTGTIDGDILVAFVTSDANTSIASTGWTVQTQNASVFGTFAILTKTAASEGASWNFTAASSKMMAQVVCVSGAASIDVVGTFPAPSSGSPQVATAITPTGAGLMLGAFFNGSATNTVSSPPAGMDFIDSQTQAYQGLFAYSEIVPSGSTGSRSITWAGTSAATQALICVK